MIWVTNRDFHRYYDTITYQRIAAMMAIPLTVCGKLNISKINKLIICWPIELDYNLCLKIK
jgi:hypothetical protein